MLYTNPSQRKHKLQHLRDGLRCESLENNTTHLVYTIDIGHAPRLAVDGRHIMQDFTDAGVVAEMDRLWTGLVFQYIILDYFYTPNSWHEQYFSETIYTEVLPILSQYPSELRSGWQTFI